MALQEKTPDYDGVRARFGIAQDTPVSEDIEIRKDYQTGIRDAIVDAALFIENTVADSREKSLALTHLEEALMWAGKAIFKN